MIFPPPLPIWGTAYRLEIKRARYSPAMHKQQTQFLLTIHIALPTPTPCVRCGLAPTIEQAAQG
jgi:hypothetical protein